MEHELLEALLSWLRQQRLRAHPARIPLTARGVPGLLVQTGFSWLALWHNSSQLTVAEAITIARSGGVAPLVTGLANLDWLQLELAHPQLLQRLLKAIKWHDRYYNLPDVAEL